MRAIRAHPPTVTMHKKDSGLSSFLRAKAAMLLLKGLAALPLGTARNLGSVIGWTGWTFGSSHARITRINLAACFPELDPESLERLGKKSLIESGKTAAEMGAMFLWPPDRLLGLIERIENESLLEGLIEEKRGVVVLLPHLSNWEMMVAFLAQKGHSVVLYRPPREPRLNDFLLAARARTGMIPVPTSQKGVVRLFKELEKGALTAILPDQQPSKKSGGVFAPFFGIPSYTATLLPKVIRKTGAVVVNGAVVRTQKGFELRFFEAADSLYSENDQEAATAMNQEVEKCIRLAPEQYVWEYKRFRYRPEGEPRFY